MGTYSYIPGPNPIGFDPTSDPGRAFKNERARSAWEGDALSEYYRSRLPGYIDDEGRYRQQADDIYNDPRSFQYSPDESGEIVRDQELKGARLTPEQAEAAARWSPEEEAAYAGDPNAAAAQFNPGWLQGTSDWNARNTRGAASEGASSIRGAIDPNKLRLDPNFAGNYVMSPEDVDKISMLTGRQAGMQFTQEMDDLRRRAAAAGSTSPLAMAAQQERLRRLQAGQAAVSGLQGRLGAEDMRRGQLRDVEQMRLDAEGRGTGLQLGAESDIANRNVGVETNAGLMAERTGKYITDTGMNQARYAEAEKSRRTGDIAGQRQGARLYGQSEPYQRTLATGDRLSDRNQTVANQRIAGAQTRGAYQTGQQTYAGGRQSDLESGRVNAFGTTANASQNAARGQLASRQPSWFNRNITPYMMQAASTATGGFTGFPGGGKNPADDLKLAEGGVVTQPTRALIGERGPEAVIPLDDPRLSMILETLKYGATDPETVGANSLRQAKDTAIDAVTSNPWRASDLRNRLLEKKYGSIDEYIRSFRPPANKTYSSKGMAQGGVVTKPTQALIGEAGPEAVIPLDKLDKMKPKTSPIRLTINIASPATEGGGAPKKMRLAA